MSAPFFENVSAEDLALRNQTTAQADLRFSVRMQGPYCAKAMWRLSFNDLVKLHENTIFVWMTSPQL